MNEDDTYGWDMNPENRMQILFKHKNVVVMKISLHEAIESSSRTQVLAHVKECDRTPWLKHWHEEAMETVVEILKGKPG
jgi:hypothetical protein